MAVKSSRPTRIEPGATTKENSTVKSTILQRGAGLLVAALSLRLLAGCGSGYEQYAPSSSEARASLEAALTSWRDGKAPGVIDVKPPVHVVGSGWPGDAQIESFTIGEEQDVGDGTKQFVVKLITKPKGAEKDEKFIVHGRDPVYVFAEQDYMRTVNMDNSPETRRPKPNSRPSTRER
jgi:hypothetical protein